MADAPTAKPTPAANAGVASALLALREQIDAVDRELLALLNRRADLALHVGEIRRKKARWCFAPSVKRRSLTG
jgi:chorismate mutase / prephenate dehydratase